jgi:hypothetical protein
MTTVDLGRIARAIIPPVGATMAIDRVDDNLKHRAAFLIDGRIRSDPVGPPFDRPRDALALVALLNGEAPRPAPQPDSTRVGISTESRDVVATPPEAPAPQVASTSRCAGCDAPLPPSRHGQTRRTCSAACRERARYHRASERAGADSDGGSRPLTPSRASGAPASPVPTASAAPSAHRLLGSARDVRPDPVSDGPTGAVPTLGLI